MKLSFVIKFVIGFSVDNKKYMISKSLNEKVEKLCVGEESIYIFPIPEDFILFNYLVKIFISQEDC